MKKYQILRRTALYAVATAIVTVGCKQNTPNPQEVSDTSIEFTVSLAGMPIEQSRAAGADVDLSILQTYGFYLAGYHTTGKVADAASDDLSPNVFSKVASDLQDPVPLVPYTNSKFTLKTIKWQLDDQTYLGFFGWSQNKTIPTTGITATTTGIIGQTKNVDDKGFPWIEIRNADAPADQTDVVGTRSIDHCNDAVISAVDLDFSHLLSKISFSAQSSSGAKVVISSVKIKYAADKVYKKARYTFGGSVDAIDAIGAYGAYAEYHTGSVALNSASVTVNGATPITLGSALLVPQALAAGDVSLELTYAISPNNGGVAGTTQTRTLPLSAISLAQGNHYLYTIDLQATEVMLSITPTIEPWSYVNTSLPLVAGAKGNTQLLLDGYEKPYQHTDGKWYWLDRSGYNRHVELGAGYVSYNVDKRGYVFSKSRGSGGVIPNLGSVSSLTADAVAEGTGSTDGQSMFKVGSFNFETPYQGTSMDWNYPGGYFRFSAPSREVINRLGYWSVTWGNSYGAQIYHNSFLRGTNSITASSQSLASNTLAPAYDGLISYLCITSGQFSQSAITAKGEELSDRFGSPERPTLSISASGPAETMSWRGENYATYSISVTSNTAWKVVATNATVSTTTGTGNMTNFKITARENTIGNSARTVQVVFSTSEIGDPAMSTTWSGTQEGKSFPSNCYTQPLPGYPYVFVASSGAPNGNPGSSINYCSNWGGRLPSLDELKVMYNYKSSYGSFISGWYWSNTLYSGDRYYLVNFGSGAVTNDNGINASRCVKDLS